MTNKELFYFTGKCLMLDDQPGFREEIVDKIKKGGIDWNKFVTNSSNHLIQPAIYLKFKSHDILRYLPDELTEFLKEVYELNLLRNNQILEQLREITTVLNKSNIYPLFLKGSGNLLDGLYSDRGERILGDIDFLVPQKDYLRTAKILEGEGYVEFMPFYGEVEDLKHYPRIMKPGYEAVLEIHQLPVSEHYQSWFNPEIVDREKKEVKALPGSYVLSDQHNIILNFIHGQLDHEGHLYGIVSFRDLYDLYLLSKRMPLTQALSNIKTKKKAIAYFSFAGKAFGLEDNFFTGSNFSAWMFKKKQDLNISSKTFYYSYRSCVYFIKRIFVGYIGQFFKSFYSRKVRQSVINRLSNPKWYGAHFHSYISFFAPNK